MAVPFPEEALRAMQDAVSLHQTLRSQHAPDRAGLRLYQSHGQVHLPEHAGMGSRWACHYGVAGLAAVFDAENLVGSFLGQRRGHITSLW